MFSGHPEDFLALAHPMATVPTGLRGQHKLPGPGCFSGALPPLSSPLLGYPSLDPGCHVAVGKAHVAPKRRSVEKWWCRRAGSQARQGDMGRPGPSSGPSVSILSRSPLAEPADGGINSPPSGPLPPSLSWGCHDNQSSPWMPKTLQKQQQRLHPQLQGKRVTAGVRTTAREACGPVFYPLHSPSQKSGNQGSATSSRQSGWGGVFLHFPYPPPQLASVPETSPQSPPSPPPSWGSRLRPEPAVHGPEDHCSFRLPVSASLPLCDLQQKHFPLGCPAFPLSSLRAELGKAGGSHSHRE